jgi:hypothetical protein
LELTGTNLAILFETGHIVGVIGIRGVQEGEARVLTLLFKNFLLKTGPILDHVGRQLFGHYADVSGRYNHQCYAVLKIERGRSVKL